MCTEITIVADNVPEETVEYFFANLSMVQVDRVCIDPKQTQINITNENCK